MPLPWYKNTIIYGLDVSRFYDTNGDGLGDLPGVTAKLDYLQRLGINCLWLLPFFPSPRRDNGYDITDYKNVDPRFGTLDDFRELVVQAHARGIKIITDLVMHHTSDQHPWFKAATADPSSPFHEYYIWLDNPESTPDDTNIFPTVEDGVWQYVRPLGKYYHHKFYHFQPDLNTSNPMVMREIKEVMDFWLSFDVDGFRIDAATHMFEQKTARHRESESGGVYLEELRNHAARRKKDVVLWGEADVYLPTIHRYSKEGKRLNMLLNFLFNNNLYLSLAREKAQPLARHFKDARRSHEHVTWVNFGRNLDEVDLERLSDAQREEVFERFAPQENMQIYGRGIRRHLSEMVSDPKMLRMVYSLIFSAPGTPMIIYGSEIGMGDDLTRPGRDSVRLPMQWSAAEYGGFSTHEPHELVGKVIPEGERGYLRTNVANQMENKDSLWHFFIELIEARHHYVSVDTAEYEVKSASNEHVLAVEYADLIVLHNLTAREQAFSINTKNTAVVFGEDCRDSHVLSKYGFSWLQKRTNND